MSARFCVCNGISTQRPQKKRLPGTDMISYWLLAESMPFLQLSFGFVLGEGFVVDCRYRVTLRSIMSRVR